MGAARRLYKIRFRIGTIAVILSCLVATVLSFTRPDEAVKYSLWHGTGTRPVQWLTSIFLHSNVWLVAAHIFFVWALGQVVEPKVGWLVMLCWLFAVAVGSAAAEQVYLAESISAGSSSGLGAVNWCLVGMALAWAPREHSQIIQVRHIRFSLPVAFVCLAYAAFAFGLALTQVVVSTSAQFQLIGFVAGLLFACILVSTGAIDCDGRDLISILRGEPGNVNRVLQRHLQVESQQRTSASEQATSKFQEYLYGGNIEEAIRFRHQLTEQGVSLNGSPNELLGVIRFLHKHGRWGESVSFMEALLRVEPDRIRVRLKLAKILLADDQYEKALFWLDGVEPSSLSTKLQKSYNKMMSFAARLKLQAKTQEDRSAVPSDMGSEELSNDEGSVKSEDPTGDFGSTSSIENSLP